MESNTLSRIKKFIDFKDFSVSFFEKEVNMSNGSFASQLKNNKTIGVDKLENILKKYSEINPEWLLTGKGEMLKSEKLKPIQIQDIENDSDFIPLISIDAMAGYGAGEVQISKKELLKGYKIPEFTQRGVEYIIRVNGSSMYPKYSSGDLLGCKTVKDVSFFQWGKIYVLDTNHGPIVKRLFPVSDDDEMLECRSDNQDYPPFKINKTSVYNVAIVIGVLRME